MKFFPLIWTSLWRKKARTIFTLLSIMIAFLLFGLLQGVNAWLNAFGTGSNANRLYVVSRVSQVEPLPSAYLHKIEAVTGGWPAAGTSRLNGFFPEKKHNIPGLCPGVPQVFQ